MNLNDINDISIKINTLLEKDLKLISEVEKGDKAIAIKTDFRYNSLHNYKLNEYVKKVFTKEYIKWIQALFKKITNDYEKVDIDFLIKGVKEK